MCRHLIIKPKNEPKLNRIKGKKHSIVGYFSTHTSAINRPTWQKIISKIIDLNNTINHLDIFDIYTALYLMSSIHSLQCMRYTPQNWQYARPINNIFQGLNHKEHALTETELRLEINNNI